MSRRATPDDLPAIVELTQRRRSRLAAWAPTFWRSAAGADQVHAMWLEHLVRTEGPIVRVVEDGGSVAACAVSSPSPHGWLVDDVAERPAVEGDDAGVLSTLFSAVTERPALVCVPRADDASRLAADRNGLVVVSNYWIRSLADVEPNGIGPAVRPVPRSGPAPLHTFGGPVDPDQPGALVVGDGSDGSLVGSPSITAPPVYDPGGTVTVVDRVEGDVDQLIPAALSASRRRGDAVLVVVTAAAEPEDGFLVAALQSNGFDQVVEVRAFR